MLADAATDELARRGYPGHRPLQIGADQLAELERRLTELVGAATIPFDTPGWMADGSDPSS
jgi:hypothetical protein